MANCEGKCAGVGHAFDHVPGPCPEKEKCEEHPFGEAARKKAMEDAREDANRKCLKKNIECLCVDGKFDNPPHVTCYPGINDEGEDICTFQLTYIFRGTCKKA